MDFSFISERDGSIFRYGGLTQHLLSSCNCFIYSWILSFGMKEDLASILTVHMFLAGSLTFCISWVWIWTWHWGKLDCCVCTIALEMVLVSDWTWVFFFVLLAVIMIPGHVWVLAVTISLCIGIHRVRGARRRHHRVQVVFLNEWNIPLFALLITTLISPLWTVSIT